MSALKKSRIKEKIAQGSAICASVRALAEAVGTNCEWSANAVDAISDAARRFKKLQDRLLSGAAVVAVIGSEKSGRSTFINALLGRMILPSHHLRCTLATTEIESVGEGNKISLAVDWLTRDQFDLLARQLSEAGERTKKDLAELDKHKLHLETLIGKAKTITEFSDCKSLREEVHRILASPDTAYAVARARIRMHIPNLSVGTVICDAPGIDSGLRLHQDALSRLLEDCDAVVLVKDITRPAQPDPEQILIEHVQAGAANQGLTSNDRLFIFLNYLDISKQDEAREKLTLARRNWAKLGIPSSQIYAGSARAQLLESANPDEWSILMPQAVANERDLKECITKSNHLQVLLNLKGFQDLQRSVIDFVDTERHNKADRDVSISLNDIRRIGKDVLSTFETEHHITDAAASPQQIWDQKFNRWINRYIDRVIGSRVNEVFGERSAEIASLANQPAEYVNGVRQAVLSLPSRIELHNIFHRYRKPLEEPEKADGAARDLLHSEIEAAMLKRGATIANRLFNLVSRLNEAVVELSWGDSGLMERLVGNEKVFREKLKSAINALLMRYARPVNEAYIYSSRNTHARKQSLEKWHHELKSIELFMGEAPDGGRDATKITQRDQDGRYLQAGPPKASPGEDGKSRPSPKPQGTFWRISSTPQTAPEMGVMDMAEGARPELNMVRPINEIGSIDDVFVKVETEILEDLSTVQAMLESGVYFASGVQQYCDQELRRVRQGITSFDLRHYWQAAAMEAFRAKHPKLMALIASEIGSSGDGHVERELVLYGELKQALLPVAAD